ncbi:hypothetical protein B0H13DRAFT_1889739 [Mycena leptocephala]|nr:hypothetical protein B0H13DRAFT_1889739 [Mycena leptocephala]
MPSPLKSVWLSSVMLSGGSSGTVTVAARAVSSAAEFGGGAGEVAGVAGLGAREEKRLDAVSDDSSEMSGVTALGLGRNLPEAARCGYDGDIVSGAARVDARTATDWSELHAR